ncbi:hypothetical protein DMN91_004568 [Ooceraea biroi]|uniref:Uncharacterized protein n=1 Tax=Ooceraea biroi TaxID=2015173 RepID=A0A3L8DPB7_OOCBI|nr:hypothetical protein DMN91_004568 [Ooceraea biroi]
MANTSGLHEKLEGRENFASWKFAMQTLLESEDLWGCIEEKPDYIADSKKMNKTKAKIILSLAKRITDTCKTPLTQSKRGTS